MIKAYIKRPGRAVYSTPISDKLENLQKAVGGYIETVTLPGGIIAICHEEGRLLCLPHNCTVEGIDFCGTVLFVGQEGEDLADVPISLKEFKQRYPELAKVEPRFVPAGEQIPLRDTAKLLAAMFGAKPCQLANVFPGMERRLPLRCRFNTDGCGVRSVSECWAHQLQYPAKIDQEV